MPRTETASLPALKNGQGLRSLAGSIQRRAHEVLDAGDHGGGVGMEVFAARRVLSVGQDGSTTPIWIKLGTAPGSAFQQLAGHPAQKAKAAVAIPTWPQ